MVNSVRIINSLESINRQILCYGITYNWNSQVQDFTVPGSSTIQPVQFNGWKNPGITLNFTIDISGSQYSSATYLSWTLWNTIVKSQYNSVLQITIGDTDMAFGSYAYSGANTTSISFRVVSYTVNMDPSDNKNSNLINITAQLLECPTL
jgi:hypothetical protein